jgi:RES domain-containing protein
MEDWMLNCTSAWLKEQDLDDISSVLVPTVVSCGGVNLMVTSQPEEVQVEVK